MERATTPCEVRGLGVKELSPPSCSGFFERAMSAQYSRKTTAVHTKKVDTNLIRIAYSRKQRHGGGVLYTEGSMAIWSETILLELKSVTNDEVDGAEPDVEPGPEDNVVGILPEDLRKFSALRAKYHERIRGLGAEILALPDKNVSERDLKIQEMQLLEEQADIINNIFWMSCRNGFAELRLKDSIGIRKGWKVVWRKRKQNAGEMLLAEMLHSIPELRKWVN